jgi:hypothetical protein
MGAALSRLIVPVFPSRKNYIKEALQNHFFLLALYFGDFRRVSRNSTAPMMPFHLLCYLWQSDHDFEPEAQYVGFIEPVLKDDLQCRSGRSQFDNFFLSRFEVLICRLKDDVFCDLLNIEVTVLVAKVILEGTKDLFAPFVDQSGFPRPSNGPVRRNVIKLAPPL